MIVTLIVIDSFFLYFYLTIQSIIMRVTQKYIKVIFMFFYVFILDFDFLFLIDKVKINYN